MLSLQELARFINRRIRDHIETSIQNNPILFSQIDQSPRNGLVTWDEYYTYLLKTLGFDDNFIRKVDRNRNSNLDRKTKELLMHDKALWNEAARSDSYQLTLDEFLAFKHPGERLCLFFCFVLMRNLFYLTIVCHDNLCNMLLKSVLICSKIFHFINVK